MNLIIITGPTACGKTSMAVRLANDIKGEIISADSRQVYRGMDIGTGKDLNEYEFNGKNILVSHHRIPEYLTIPFGHTVENETKR